ncbi:DUF2784 domain-containing protein [Nocardiopsis gilva YIM 90087]|uniref:DUF2784 domain-containing protein n=1 Tax=Nocardiopsis gilva YIM 90087 TaxID=1235441 RepID=A0A223S5V8_9ACTN|nr:DUF2784 domain-containing protein [Nocardiopsis gilva]ASU83495.1 DUF2784 domain-containing protein [Nocardiopsis gilva YIM 90087]
MAYRVLGETAMLLHFAFLVYVTLGGFLAWRWPRLIWPHFVCAGYGILITLIGWPCPLTGVEDWAREKAGQEGLAGSGFIDHYLTGVIYPEQYLDAVRFGVGVLIFVAWTGVLLLQRRRSATAHAR